MCTITQIGKKYKKDKDIKPNECANKNHTQKLAFDQLIVENKCLQN
jgi:hypothetical protein